MTPFDSATLELLWFDVDSRATVVRKCVTERLAAKPPPLVEDHVVATYFLALRSTPLHKIAREIAYHATSGIKDPHPGSLLAQCSAHAAGVDPWDANGRMGLVHMAFPLKMLLQPDGHLTSCDLLHTAAAAIIFDVFENQDAQLVSLHLPPQVLASFPGPAYGPEGLRRRTNFAPQEPAFGTILKPTAGITPDEVGQLVAEAAPCPLFLFVKEDEDLYPNLDYSPISQRVRRAVEAIERAREKRQGKGLIFAPHITGTPHELTETLRAALEAGATGVMFSESFAGGTVRLVREATRNLAQPPAIYGHNAGIGVKTRGGIWREVIDLLARLDGIDFRQTAPIRPGPPFLRPYGPEWRASEEILSRPLPGIKPTMIARAGGLDQGNIIPNLEDAESRGLASNILFLAGSAINSIKNHKGQADPHLGAEAMQQALDVYRSGELAGLPLNNHLSALTGVALRRRLSALLEALRQRYPGKIP
jgi:ribulose 1,5-bisphosphate carboxylase large subunit-like protein